MNRRAKFGRLAAPVVASVLAAAVPAAAAPNQVSAGGSAAEPDRGRYAAPMAETVSLSPRTGRPAGNVEFSSRSMSGDGRFVLFVDNAGGASGDRACQDTRCLLLRDLRRDVTTVVSARSDGTSVGSRDLIWAEITDDGRLAAFSAEAYGLGPAGRPPEANLFVKHLRSGRLEAIAAPPDAGVEGRRLHLSVRAVSGDGRFVGVRAGSRSGAGYAYLYDRVADTWTRLPGPYQQSDVLAMDASGRYVAVDSYRAPEGGADLFLYDRRTGESRQVPPGPSRADANVDGSHLSGDGRLLFVAWHHYDFDTDVDTHHQVVYRTSDLKIVEVIEDIALIINAVSPTGRYLVGAGSGALFGSDRTQAVRYDRRTDTVALASRGRNGEPANSRWSAANDISAGGRTVLFSTPAGNIAPEGDDRPHPVFFDEYNDVFVTELNGRLNEPGHRGLGSR